MIYNIYKLYPHFCRDGVHKGETLPELIFQVDTGEASFYDFMNENWYDTLVWQQDLQDKLEINTTYYAVAKDYSNFGTLTIYKGHTFFDTAEHDERVIIAVELGLTNEQARILPRET